MTGKIVSLITAVILALPLAACGKTDVAAPIVFEDIPAFEAESAADTATESATPDTAESHAADVQFTVATFNIKHGADGLDKVADAIRGAGGIPVGTGGKAAVLISGGIDSPVAAYMMARRGLKLTAIHFASPPYTSQRAEEKVVRLLQKVSRYATPMTMYTVPFTEIQEKLRDDCPEELFTIIMRRLMMQMAERIAKDNGCAALITGESLGQVASQTIGALGCTDEATDMVVFRPLIGMDKQEIIDISYKIDTYETSIEPYEDCCTVFTPKHPRTKPILKFVKAAQEQAGFEPLIEKALQNLKVTQIYPE